MQQGYWCWEDYEVLNLIERLKEHNAPLAPDERIAFVGIDVRKVETAPPELLAGLEGHATKLNAKAGVSGANPRALADAAQAIRRLMAGGLACGAPEAAGAVRALTDAAPKLATTELSALCRNTARYVDTYLNPDFFGTRAMGHHLREALGERYLALGMLFGEGAFLARSWEERKVSEFQIGQAGKGHVERCFAGRELGLFDAVHMPVSAAANYRRFLGSLYDHAVDATLPETFRIERPLADFDLVAWLPDVSSASPHSHDRRIAGAIRIA